MGSKEDKSSENKKMKEPPLKKEPPGILSRLFFCWMFPLFYYGNQRDLEEYDLVPVRKVYNSKVAGDKLEKTSETNYVITDASNAGVVLSGDAYAIYSPTYMTWFKEQQAAKAEGRKPSLLKALYKTFFWSFIPGGIMQFMSIMLRTLTPLLFSQLLSYWSPESQISQTVATYYAISMIVANLLSAYLNHHGNLYCQQFGMKLRVALTSVMFRKIMRMSNGSLGETTAGKIVNLMSNDLQRFDITFLFLHYIWIIPIQLAIVLWLGYTQAGYAAFIGIISMAIIALPIQVIVGQALGKVRRRNAENTDSRIKVMSEVINGIQVIKMYAWEIPFQKLVEEKRNTELVEVKKATILRIILLSFMLFTERTALFLTILTFIFLGNSMSANVIYPLQQFMSAVQFNITLVLPLVLSFVAELFVSLGRVQEFISLQDREDFSQNIASTGSTGKLFRNISNGLKASKSKSVEPLSYHKNFEINFPLSGFGPRNTGFRRSISHHDDTAVMLHDVSASWTGDPNMLALKNISMRLKKGKLCAIIGAVGSGKSSILQLLLKELPAATGTVSTYGKISYACQEAWLFPATVRENILFDLSFDPEKYKRVCKVCALEKDFKQFPYGDQTLVGERGVSLSGGQRARINLARSVYREADIYLLDDPLSAVDANVGRQLFDGCINGYLRGHTRILVTHQIHFLKAADFIVVLNEGRIENMGTFDELATMGKDFSMMLSSLQESKDKDTESMSSRGSENKDKRILLRSQSSMNEDGELENFEEQKMVDEERQSGNLRWGVIVSYFRSGGSICFLLLVLSLNIVAAAAGAATDYWISYWSNQMAAYEEELDGAPIDPGLDVQIGAFTIAQYLIIHGVIVGLTILFTNIRIFPFAEMCVSASKILHNNMFSTMIKGIMRFFDTSSSGRILNRFTKDMGALDEILPRTLLDVFQMYASLAAILILNALALYWTVIPSVVLLILFGFLVKFYMNTAQSVKRLEGTTKSPVFNMITASLNGIATIRSSGAESRLIDEFDTKQDLHTAAWNGYLGGGTTFGFYLDTVCLIYLGSIIFVFLYIDFGDIIPVGSVGLAVTQSNMLTAMLQHGARMLVDFLAQLTSAERILEYTRIETESNLFEGQIPMPPLWPSQGKINFENVSLRYAPEEDAVLKNLNITVDRGWKVGIVGRTGAGKSSLISALFRFAYLTGKITIDGIDTALISKQGLRSKISIIPQEPVLFSATIRYNLDPFNIYSDNDIWRALEQVDLKSAIPSLDFKVTEGGANFSVGQRQLMCLARAVLRSNKVLIMDEATANVDPQTDNFIQQTIRRQFADCTVLTIAHRLNTIMDSDRVLVMSFGEVMEYDHPYTLLSDPDSHLSSMVRETGEKNSTKLFEVAKEAYFQSNLKENAR